MTKDDIIRMAREAGFEADESACDVWVTDGYWVKELERFAALVAAAEREWQSQAEPDSWRTYARNEHGLPVFFCASEVKQAGPGLIPLYTAPPAQQESVAWISVKDALPKAVRGVSYKASLTDVVLVRHQDRPDYPITAHAVVGEDLGAGVAIPTDGASEHTDGSKT